MTTISTVIWWIDVYKRQVVMRISEKVLDLVTVNLLFVLSCLPVLTIGIAKISLYQTVFAIKHQRRVPVIRSYAKAFRDNWKIGLQLGSLELIVARCV